MTAGNELLTVSQMYEADRLAMDAGVSGLELMEAAGKGIAGHILENWPAGRCLVLCGPGNNGGDGYVIARHLKEAGWDVVLLSTCDPATLTGDAAEMRIRWNGPSDPIENGTPRKIDLVVDAVFGAGFSRELGPDIASLFSNIAAAEIPVVAVDVPSGLNGDTGAADPATLKAVLTVTFFRPKPGHYLYPGREYCGRLEVIDIGIDARHLHSLQPKTRLNSPDLWRHELRPVMPQDHKYSRGHVAIVGGGVSSTGAARLAARCCLRVGAGACTVVSAPSALSTYAATLEAVMVRSCQDAADFSQWIRDRRIGVILLGPGSGVTARTRVFVEAALKSPATVILDADALTVFSDDPHALFTLIKDKRTGHCIMTPHEAEFNRLFQEQGSKLARALSAAEKSGAIILLKGADTVIATPQGEAFINHNAPPYLATAGSGDALAGLISGLTSSEMPAIGAVCAAAWMHGDAGNRFGPGLIAEDIELEIPGILADFSDADYFS